MKSTNKIVLTLAVAAFVFVVLCPDIPPPSGVKDHSDSPTLVVRPVAVILISASSTLTAAKSRGRTLTGEAIVALTCARLC